LTFALVFEVAVVVFSKQWKLRNHLSLCC